MELRGFRRREVVRFVRTRRILCRIRADVLRYQRVVEYRPLPGTLRGRVPVGDKDEFRRLAVFDPPDHLQQHVGSVRRWAAVVSSVGHNIARDLEQGMTLRY